MRPSRLSAWLLRRTLPPDDVDNIVGDLLETARGESLGRVWLEVQALLFAASFGWARLRRRLGIAEHRTVREVINEGGLDMEGWMRDVKIAARSLLKRPGFAGVIIVTLGLGIGANTAIFSVIQGAVLRPLPFPEPDRLVWLSDGYREWGGHGSSMSLPNFLDLKAESRLLAGAAAYQFRSMNLAGEDRPERVLSLAVGPDFLSVLGVRPVLGRDFVAEDNVEGATTVAILSQSIWRGQFGGTTDIVGKTVLLDGSPVTVVGVLPEAFEFRSDPRLLIPLQYEGLDIPRGRRGFNAVGRIAEGATLEGMQDELQGIFARLADAYPVSNEGWQVWADPLKDLAVGSQSVSSLRLLGGAVLLVLLIACVNVANLLLVRSESRQRELAVRMAMGAGRGRLVPLFLSESLILGFFGGVLGIVLAYWGIPLLVSMYGNRLPRAGEVGLNAPVLGFALGLALLTGLVVGILPVLRANLGRLQEHLKEGTRAVSRASAGLRNGLVVTEIALAVVLVAGAGLVLNSFWRLNRVDIGLEAPEQVLVAQLALSRGTYAEDEARIAFYREFVDGVDPIPGVAAVGLTNRLPLNGGYNITNVYAYDDAERVSRFVELRMVSPGFFDATGIRLLAGRMLEDADGDDGINVLANRELAVQLFGSPEAAVGQLIRHNPENERSLRVVGVVSDIRDMGVQKAPPPGYYLALGTATVSGGGAIALIRAHGDPNAVLPQVRDVVQRLDPTLPVYGTRLLSDVVAQSVGGTRFNLSLLGAFAVLALVLGAVGIYGVMSYAVAQRTREVGVRMALGARRGEVVGLVLGAGARLALAGVALGVIAAMSLGKFMADMLYQVSPTDPLTHGAVALLLLGVAMLACYLPARRASGVDPVNALRSE